MSEEEGNAEEVNNTDVMLFTLSVLVPLTLLFLCCGYLNFRYGCSQGFLQVRAAPILPTAAGEVSTTTATATAATADEEALRHQQQQQQRMIVLEKIFPPSTPENGNAKLFVYDVESKRYNPQPPTAIVMAQSSSSSSSCSICLEDFNASSVIMTASCSHSYHRPCILSWVKEHTDCPNCRAGIYDQTEFENITRDTSSSTTS